MPRPKSKRWIWLTAAAVPVVIALALWALSSADTEILKAIKREPIMSYTPPGFERAGDEEYDEVAMFGGNHDNVGHWYEVTYRREGATEQDVERAVTDLKARAAGAGFAPPDNWPTDSAKPLVHGARCVADLTVEPRGDDALTVKLEFIYYRGSGDGC